MEELKMCDNHRHNKIEEWITPINSRHLSSKMVHLFPGDHIHAHTTGPGREEVLVILFGTLTITTPAGAKEYTSGEACFIPENTVHRVDNASDAPAQYAYIVTKRTFNAALVDAAKEGICLATL